MSFDSYQLKAALTSNTDGSLQYILEAACMNFSNPEFEKSVVSVVNNLLASGKTRLIGLELIQDLILYCSYDTLSENVISWSRYCVVRHAEDLGKEVKLNTLTKILEDSSDMEFFTKKFSAEYLNDTLKACLVYQNNAEKIAGLKCLTQCMKRCPSWFSNHKQKIEPYLINCLENDSEVEVAAIAFVYFLQTGPSGVSGVNYTNNFFIHFKNLCATIQFLYNNFFSNFPEIDNSLNVDGQIYEQLKNGLDGDNSMEVAANRILNCLTFLKRMIAEKFSIEKQIVLKYVFDVIRRGLSVHVCFSETSTNVNNRAMFLKKIQLRLLGIFRIFIKGYQYNLMPFAPIVENTLLNNLQRIDKCGCFVFDKSYKASIYETLATWLSFIKIVDDLHFQKKFIPIILDDIFLIKKAVTLNVDVSGPKRKKLTNDPQINRKALISDVVKERNCIHALEVLKCLLSTSISFEQKLLKDLLDCIIKTLEDIQVDNISAPYNNVTCQIKLYEAFISTLKMKELQILLPSIHSMISVLTRGVGSRNPKISLISDEGLVLLEKISHPVCRSLDSCDSQLTIVGNKRRKLVNEIFEIDEKKTEKEIKIISDIVITRPHDTKQDNGDDDYEMDEEPEIISLSDTTEEPQIDIKESENLDVGIENEEDRKATSNGVTEIIVCTEETKEQDSNTCSENVANDKEEEKGVGDGVEDMVDSFIDEIQE